MTFVPNGSFAARDARMFLAALAPPPGHFLELRFIEPDGPPPRQEYFTRLDAFAFQNQLRDKAVNTCRGDPMNFRVACLLLAAPFAAYHGVTSLLAGTLPVVDTTKYDQLDVANHEPGPGDLTLPTGGSVSLFNGNLNLTIPLGPAYPQDGLLPPIQLVLTYNSKNARLSRVRDGAGTSDYLTGRSWVGFGWTAHLGRIYKQPVYHADTSTYELDHAFYEFPNGAPYRFETTVKRAQPNTSIRYYRDCTGLPEPDPPPPAYCVRYPDAPRCDPQDPCDNRPNDPEHYDFITADGTVHRLENRVAPSTPTAAGWIKNIDRAGFYTTSVKDLYANEFKVNYSNGVYREAITRIWSAAFPDGLINTELCPATPTTDCPSGTAGMLYKVFARGFQGSRADPLQTVYTLSYSTVTVTDADGAQLVPLNRPGFLGGHFS